MMHLGDIDDLISAVRSLAPDPLMEIVVPSAVGLVGVIAGFGLSTWKESAARKRAKRAARQAGLAESRRPAVNALVRHMEWAIGGFQLPSMDMNLAISIDAVVPLFTQTGEPEDLTIAREARRFLEALSSMLLGTGRVGAEGSWWEWTATEETRLLGLSTQIAEFGKLWVDDDLSTAAFNERLAVGRIMLEAYAPASSL